MNRDRYRSVRQHRRVCVRGVFQSRVWRERVLSFFATASSGRCVAVVWPWCGRGVVVARSWSLRCSEFVLSLMHSPFNKCAVREMILRTPQSKARSPQLQYSS